MGCSERLHMNTSTPAKPDRRGALSVAGALGVLACLVTPTLADPVAVADLELLLRGGVEDSVVQRHVERWGLERDLDAADLLALKEAGASAALLEMLVGTASQEVRSTRAESLSSGDALLLTNLDERGRRIGGEISEPSPFNRVQPPVARYDAVGRAPSDRSEYQEQPEAPASLAPPRGITLERPFRNPYYVPYHRYGTPGGYTRYKLFYSRAPYDGFRTWVPPVALVVGSPVLVTTQPGGVYGPTLFPY